MCLSSSGVYQIRNIENNKIYVGSAVNFKSRWELHRSCLKNNKHHSIHLQRAWNKHGEDNFVFEILEVVERQFLLEVEQSFLDNLLPSYNICTNARSRLGLKNTYEQNRKIGEANKKNMLGKRHSEETKRKIGNAHRGRVSEKRGIPLTGQHRNRIALARQGRSHITKTTRLSKEDVLYIREAYETERATQQELAKQFNVNQSTISDAINRITWRNI
jgi:group I intron endonuclease